VATASSLQLAAVQLHGHEDQAAIAALREQLPATCQIWKAYSVGDTLPPLTLAQVDRVLLDNGKGGSGQSFDWSLLQGQSLQQVLLAGGLGPSNVAQAATLGVAGLDFNSGVESQPGIKDPQKIAAVFRTLRTAQPCRTSHE
jgi:indole-3-glycerol phosphate synthase/phosphoribosylanthranilate isomerase